MFPLSPEFPIEWLRTFRCSLKVIGHLKTVDGGNIGRTTLDVMLDRIVGFEVALVSFRKPEWDWSRELTLAQDPSTLSPMALMLEHPGVLFSMEWIDRAIKICEETGMMAMANSAKNTDDMEENYYTV